MKFNSKEMQLPELSGFQARRLMRELNVFLQKMCSYATLDPPLTGNAMEDSKPGPPRKIDYECVAKSTHVVSLVDGKHIPMVAKGYAFYCEKHAEKMAKKITKTSNSIVKNFPNVKSDQLKKVKK